MLSRMAPGKPVDPDPPACPLLGLAGDPRTRFTFPHAGHRCHATRRPIGIQLAWQSRYCLSAEFVACDRFQALVPKSEALARLAASYGVSGPPSSVPASVPATTAKGPGKRPGTRPKPPPAGGVDDGANPRADRPG